MCLVQFRFWLVETPWILLNWNLNDDGTIECQGKVFHFSFEELILSGAFFEWLWSDNPWLNVFPNMLYAGMHWVQLEVADRFEHSAIIGKHSHFRSYEGRKIIWPRTVPWRPSGAEVTDLQQCACFIFLTECSRPACSKKAKQCCKIREPWMTKAIEGLIRIEKEMYESCWQLRMMESLVSYRVCI